MSDLVVRPVRFTDNLDAMRGFLGTLGLAPRVESVSGGWVDMVAGGGDAAGGMVALHSARDSARGAPSGLTALSFEADDIDLLAERLKTAGVPEVTVYDEAYGRVLTCRDPFGDQIAVDERSTDLYGYRRHDDGASAPGWSVIPIRFTDPSGPYGAFLEALGLVRRAGASEHFAAYGFSTRRHGAVGLHPPTDDGSFLAEADGVRLSFETVEPLDAVQERLARDGFPAVVRAEAFGSVVEVLDPDGVAVEVLTAPTAAMGAP